jgi:putative SOS response-associated peptidase YedK
MCGRAKLPGDVSEIKLDLQIDWDSLGDFQPRWNAAPTMQMPAVISVHGERVLTSMRWGLIPSWAKDTKIARTTFNARAETIDETPAFRDAWYKDQRCIVIADGYYEWRKADKQPFAIALENRGPMTFAGVWDKWQSNDGAIIKSFSIITTRANELLSKIHDRMPALIPPDQWAAWLGEIKTTHAALRAMLRPYPSERMAMWPVSRRVGNVRNDSPDLFEPLAEAN